MLLYQQVLQTNISFFLTVAEPPSLSEIGAISRAVFEKPEHRQVLANVLSALRASGHDARFAKPAALLLCVMTPEQ